MKKICSGVLPHLLWIMNGTKFHNYSAWKGFEFYFGYSIDEADENWVPQMCCNDFSIILKGWVEGSHKTIPFTEPMIWSEPQNQENDC